jgi:hypothetical protein
MSLVLSSSLQVRRQFLLAQSNRVALRQTSQSNGFDLHCARILTAWRAAKKDRASIKDKGVGWVADGSGSSSDIDVASKYEKRQGGGFGLGFGGLSKSTGSGSAASAADGGTIGSGVGSGLLDEGTFKDGTISSGGSLPTEGGRSAFGGGLGFNFAARPKTSSTGPSPGSDATRDGAAIATGTLTETTHSHGTLAEATHSHGGSSEDNSTPAIPPKPAAKPPVRNMLDMY